MVKFDKVTLGYGRQPVIAGLDLAIARGDFFGLVGPNGTGKTTILKAILGLVKPMAGRVARAGETRFGYCVQRQAVDDIFPFTVAEIVMMGRTNLIGPLVNPGDGDRAKVAAALERTGLSDLGGKKFRELSGGQKQRALIARALALEPTCLVLDEPTTDLDIRGSREVLDLVQRLHREGGLTVILVSHELNKVLNYAHNFLFLTLERRAVSVGRAQLTEELLRDIFGLQLKLRRLEEGW